MTWIRNIGAEPMLAVNLGTRTATDAARLVEYANHPSGTTLSDLRRQHGHESPFDVRLWCLGNEMDGPWQIGHCSADEYGRRAVQAAQMMRLVDPTIELVLCGSSGPDMPTFGAWERTVLEHAYEHVDFLSLHAYYEPTDGDVASFLASATAFEDFILTASAIVDDVGRRHKTSHTVRLAVDEWNVWYKSDAGENEPTQVVRSSLSTRRRVQHR